MARVLLAGATGTIGQATARALLRRGHAVVGLVRDRAGPHGLPPRVEARACDVTDARSLREHGLRRERFDAVVSCLASRTGVPADAWAIDHQAHLNLLAAAQDAGAAQMVLLSAICVQRPVLAFQQAKLAFERALIDSGLDHSIVRPTAFFKSLCGQVERVRQGRPFLVFGDGTLTACKPISDDDLANYLVDCLGHPQRSRHILPIGGPGPAITPRAQGELLFEALGRPPRFRQVPVGLLDAIVGTLTTLSRVAPALATKAELARIGRYYATESMLVHDPATGRPDEAATPSTGHETLGDFYRALADGSATLPERREHAVF